MKKGQNVHTTASQGPEHKDANPFSKFFTKHPSLGRFTAGSLVIAGLIGGFTAKPALAQQPQKAPTEQTGTEKTRDAVLTEKGRVELLVSFMIAGIQQKGAENALKLLKPAFKEAFNINEDVTTLIHKTVVENLEKGIIDSGTITNEIMPKLEFKYTPIKPSGDKPDNGQISTNMDSTIVIQTALK